MKEYGDNEKEVDLAYVLESELTRLAYCIRGEQRVRLKEASKLSPRFLACGTAN